MEITTGSPASRVTIYTDDRKFRVTSALGQYDSEILAINTNKDLGNPAGTFNILFVPKKDSSNFTWFDKIDAYDYAQIEFKGINDPDFRVVMRGLIDTVNFSESWEGGTPQRSITVSGRDLGCLLTDHQIYYIPELSKEAALEGMLTYMAWKNFIPGPVNAYGAFKVIWERFQHGLDLSLGGGQIKQKFDFFAAQSFENDKTNLWHLKGYEGPYWNAFAQYQDKPFHELFVYDDFLDESNGGKSWLILRPVRFKDARGTYHNSVTDYLGNPILYPKDFTFKNKDLVAINVNKNQNEVYNYYITIPTLQLLSKMSFRGLCLSTTKGSSFKDSENPFFQTNKLMPAYIGKYGFRKLEATTYFINLDVGQLEEKDRGKNYEEGVLVPAFIKTGIERNRMLVAWFMHNEFLFSGTIDIAGTNRATMGTYAQNEDDKMEYYTEGVSHSWVLFQHFRTSLRVSRGQPQSSEGGLVGNKYGVQMTETGNVIFGLKEKSMNRYYFGGGGTTDVYGPVKWATINKEQEKQKPKDDKKLVTTKTAQQALEAKGGKWTMKGKGGKFGGHGATGSW
jgi:hypothetical protein